MLTQMENSSDFIDTLSPLIEDHHIQLEKSKNQAEYEQYQSYTLALIQAIKKPWEVRKKSIQNQIDECLFKLDKLDKLDKLKKLDKPINQEAESKNQE